MWCRYKSTDWFVLGLVSPVTSISACLFVNVYKCWIFPIASDVLVYDAQTAQGVFKMCADHSLLPEGSMSYSELFLMFFVFFFPKCI